MKNTTHTSTSEEQTKEIAAYIATTAKAGDIFILNGDMGAGKTAFSKGFAKGLGISTAITSPTFTILNIYDGSLPLYHFDLYRLSTDENSIYDQGFEEYFFGKGICLIEWGELAINIIQAGYTQINIKTDQTQNQNYRTIEITNH